MPTVSIPTRDLLLKINLTKIFKLMMITPSIAKVLENFPILDGAALKSDAVGVGYVFLCRKVSTSLAMALNEIDGANLVPETDIFVTGTGAVSFHTGIVCGNNQDPHNLDDKLCFDKYRCTECFSYRRKEM